MSSSIWAYGAPDWEVKQGKDIIDDKTVFFFLFEGKD